MGEISRTEYLLSVADWPRTRKGLDAKEQSVL
jgi:hypothetical protein